MPAPGAVGTVAAAMAGSLLLAAGAAKLFDRDAVAPLLRGVGVPVAFARAARVAVPWAEMLTGAWLMAGVSARSAALVACTLAALFVATLLVASARGVAEPCRCFGVLDRARSHGVAVARALLLLGATAVAAAGAEGAVASPPWWLGVLLALCAVAAFALVGEVIAFRSGVRRYLAAQTHID
jgi:putative oxidoreductase